MNKQDSSTQERSLSSPTKGILWAIGLYLLWTLATYLLEGRVGLYQHPTVSGRYIFVLVANVLIGIIGTLLVTRHLLNSRFIIRGQSGFRPAMRTSVSILIAVVVGGIYFLLARPSQLSLLMVLNGYTQVLPVSIAEVLVCWVLVGTSFESLTGSRGTVRSVLAGIVAATLFFSVYHIGHSAPFDQLGMMLFLLIPGLLTSLFYFFSREIYSTIIFHNFQGTVGVLGNLDNPAFLNRPLFWLYLLLIISVLVLMSADRLLIRRVFKPE